MQPLCNLLAVAVSDHQSRDIPRPGQVPIRRRAQWRAGTIARPARSRLLARQGQALRHPFRRRSDISGVIGVNPNGPSDARDRLRAHR